MDGRKEKESSQMSETNCPEGNVNEHAKHLVKAIQEPNGSDKNANNASNGMREDFPDDEKDIQVQASTVVKKKNNLRNSEEDSAEKKRRSVQKQNYKARHTVPQPFSLSSEKKMSKAIRRPEQSSTSLSRSLSFKSSSHDPLKTVQTSLRLERITELRQWRTKSGSIQHVLHTQTSLEVERSNEMSNGSSKSISTDKEHSEKQVEISDQKKGKRNQVEIKKSQSSLTPKCMDITKHEKRLPFKATPLPNFYHKKSATPNSDSAEEKQVERDIELMKHENVSSFKAAALPRFYHRRSASLKPDSPDKTEGRKLKATQISSTFKATPLPSFYQKRSHLRKQELIKIPLTSPMSPNVRSASKHTSDLGNDVVESTKNVASQKISDGAKETIKILLKGPWKAPDKKSKVSETVGPDHVVMKETKG